MLKVIPKIPTPLTQYKITNSFTKEEVTLSVESIFTEEAQNTDGLICYAYVGKKLIYSGFCTEVSAIDPAYVTKTPPPPKPIAKKRATR